jgi:anaerobic selenocysteine-containing dehydrogenase
MFSSEYERRQAGTWDESKQRAVDTICPYCGVGCTVTLHVQDNEIVKVTSPYDASITKGNLCVKGRFGWRYVQERPRGPERRASGNGADGDGRRSAGEATTRGPNGSSRGPGTS